ncbi:hypothetical protein [Floridanema evergladense]|uniref:TolC family protein n=1 Tax=Floridaenema evergladense BLCC-F167 TaxID=3153639 RepID=A0ABV4WTX6_9CYAN
MAQKLTKFQYEYQAEEISQEIRGLKIEQLLLDKTIEENKLEAKRWDVETSKEGIRKAKLGYEQAVVTNDISEEKLIQSKDLLNFERGMTGVNREQLLIAGKSAILALQEAQVQFEENTKLFELRYQVSGSVEFQPIGGASNV